MSSTQLKVRHYNSVKSSKGNRGLRQTWKREFNLNGLERGACKDERTQHGPKAQARHFGSFGRRNHDTRPGTDGNKAPHPSNKTSSHQFRGHSWIKSSTNAEFSAPCCKGTVQGHDCGHSPRLRIICEAFYSDVVSLFGLSFYVFRNFLLANFCHFSRF